MNKMPKGGNNLKTGNKNTSVGNIPSSECESAEGVILKQDDTFRKLFAEALEGLQIKSSVVRTKNLSTICELLNQYKPNLIYDFKDTLIESVIRCIKKGKDLEVLEALKLVPILCIQLECGQLLCSELNDTLKTFIHNEHICYPIRTLSCEILGVLNFLIGTVDTTATVFDIMTSLEDILNDTYLRGSSTESFGQSGVELYASALQAWGLLYTSISSTTMVNYGWITNLSELLISTNLALRLIAGESIVLLMEQDKIYNDKVLHGHLNNFIQIIKGLANKTYKIVAKHDRKVHNSLIRDIVNYYEEDIIPNRRVKLDNDILNLDTWALQIQYKCIKEILGTSMKVHLCKNNFLRAIFNLGPIPERLDKTTLKQMRTQQDNINSASERNRSILRNKNRDKRSSNDFLNEDYF